MKVTLTLSEVFQAATVGVMRRVCDLRDKRKGAHGIPPDAPVWEYDVEGCCGEMAVAKALRVYWSGAHGKLRVPDVGDRYQVRTRSKMSYDLVLYPEDDDHAIFILVLGRAPTYEVAGWLVAADGKRPEYWKNPSGRPAFFVPRGVLRPLAELPEVTR